MDNQTRAANIIAHGMKNDDSPARIAKHLHDYGLLAEDHEEELARLREGLAELRAHSRYAAQFHADKLTVPEVFNALDVTLTKLIGGNDE